MSKQKSWRVGYGYADYLSIEEYYPDEDAWWSIAMIELDEHGAEPTPEQEANARLIATAPDTLAVLKMVEWVSTPYQMTEDTRYCPWCRGVDPDQWEAEHKAQEMVEISDATWDCLGHADDCQRQIAIAKAELKS